ATGQFLKLVFSLRKSTERFLKLFVLFLRANLGFAKVLSHDHVGGYIPCDARRADCAIRCEVIRASGSQVANRAIGHGNAINLIMGTVAAAAVKQKDLNQCLFFWV